MRRSELFLLTLLALPGCASQSRVDQIEYIVVNKTVAIDKRPWLGKGNLRPWEQREVREADGTTSMIVSNSCGFAEVIYQGQPLSEYLAGNRVSGRDFAAVASMGEWCRLRELDIGPDKLVQLRNWHGDRFLESSALVLRDGKGQPFIIDADFIENAQLAGLAVRLEPDLESDACIPRIELTAELLEELRAEAEIAETTEGACFVHGVYLRDLLAFTRGRSN